MKRFVPRIAAVLFLVVAGALAPAAAGERPFNASGAGSLNDGYMNATFEAMHLGKAHLSGYVDPIFFLRNSHSDRGFTVQLSAANGDVLYLDCHVDYVVDHDTGTGIAIGTATFDGGTGRFQDAAVSANVMVEFDQYNSSLNFLIDGSIDY